MLPLNHLINNSNEFHRLNSKNLFCTSQRYEIALDTDKVKIFSVD